MNLEVLFHSPILRSIPDCRNGWGGADGSGYLATQWLFVTRRYAFEAKRNRLELTALGKRIEILNLKVHPPKLHGMDTVNLLSRAGGGMRGHLFILSKASQRETIALVQAWSISHLRGSTTWFTQGTNPL